MRLPLYRRQLVQDLDDWIAAGLVPAQNRTAILAHVDQPGRFGMAAILSILGAVLIGAAALSFVAANWQGLDKLPRLVILFGGLWLSFGLAAFARSRAMDVLAEVCLLIGIMVYGAAIWFVSQTYHLEGGLEDGLLLWSLGALVAALLAASQVGAVLGFLLAIAWIEASWANGSDLVLALFPPICLAAMIASIRLEWRVAAQAGMLAVVAYLILLVYRGGDLVGWREGTITIVLASLSLALWALLNAVPATREWIARPSRFWAIIVAIIATVLAPYMQIALRPHEVLPVAAAIILPAVLAAGFALALKRLPMADAGAVVGLAIALAGLSLAAPPDGDRGALEVPFLIVVALELIWVIALGVRRGDRLAVNLGFAAFGAWVIYLYVAVFDSFLNSAVFFAVGGILLIALGILLDRIRRRMLARAGATP